MCRFQRPPGAIPSSMLGFEAMTGALEDFGVEDYLNGNKTLTKYIVVCFYFIFLAIRPLD